jgi:hypothetical protein
VASAAVAFAEPHVPVPAAAMRGLQAPVEMPSSAPAPVPTLAELISLEDLDVPQLVTAEDFLPEPETDRGQRGAMDPARAVAGDHDGRAGVSPYSAFDDSLADLAAGALAAETVHAVKPSSRGAGGGSRLKLIAAAVILVGLIGGGVYASKRSGGAAPPVPQLGTLLVQSSPAGVEVFVDGVSRGMTPATVSVSAGSHILELRGRGVPRVIPLQVPAGGQVSQYLEFVDTPTTGMLVVHSQPVGANVTVDGVARGVAPITIEGLASGDHEVVLQSAAGTSRHSVKVLAGTTASLVAPVVAAPAPVDGPVSGWVSVKAPFLIEIREDGQLIGTTETDRLMLASGRHSLEFVNPSLGFRETRTVQVLPGKVAPLVIELPQGSVSLNASPWAEVWIDGRRIGETPIANVPVPIGPHEIVFRHPELGEKKQAVSVTTGAPVRVSVSMK